jgi:hypothetical protein
MTWPQWQKLRKLRDPCNIMKTLQRTASLLTAVGVLLGTASTGLPAEVLTQGFLKAEHYYDIPGVSVDDLFASPKFPDSPDRTFYTGIAGVPQTNPDLNNFGVRITGWVSPSVTGTYYFFLRSDDASELFINETAGGNPPDPFVDPLTAREPACCNPFQEPGAAEQTSLPITMTAGQRYGITILMKEGGGGDYVFVAWRNVNDTTPAADLEPISGANLWAMVDPTGRTFEITQQPQSVTAVEERTATFSVGLESAPEPGEYSIQWYRNGQPMAGETGVRYTTPVLTVADSGTTYQARMLTILCARESEVATLTVVPDTFPPVPSAGALVSTDGTTIDIGIGFDEAVTDATASVAANYSIAQGTISSFEYYPRSQSALLKVTGLAPGASTTVTVQNVADVKGNAITSVTVPVTVSSNLRWNVVGGQEVGLGNWVVPVAADGFDVYADGIGQWASYDESTFVYEEITGDFDKKLQVIYQDLSSQWARAGLIARDATNFGVGRAAQEGGQSSRYQKIHANPVGPTLTGPGNLGNNTFETNRRLRTGGQTDAPGAASPVLYPDAWVRLQRVDQTFTMYHSLDGEEWVQIAATTWGTGEQDGQPILPMPAMLYVGPDYSPENGNVTNLEDRDVWLAQFRNYSDTFALPPTEPLTIGISEGVITINYSSGTLQSVENLGGTWSDVAGATSPYTVTPAAGTTRFYRTRN